jgi:hypothetical protein
LTEEEKLLPEWSDLDDSSLGKAVRHAGFLLDKIQKEHCDDREKLFDLTLKAGAVAMCCRLHAIGADKDVITLTGITGGTQSIGDWRVTYERIGIFGTETK